MAKNTSRSRSFRAGLRSRFDVRALLKGDSYFIRAAIFLVMSGIFILLLTVTKRGARNARIGRDSTEAVDSVQPRMQTVPTPRSTSPIKPRTK